MFVVTADQIDSSGDVDRVPEAFALLDDLSPRLVLPPDRNAGDEIQLVTRSADTALEVVLRLRRDEHWSVGLGVGAVREPLPSEARAAAGPAFNRARDAVDAAKRSPSRFALEAETGGVLDGDQVGALIDLLLALRGRRTPEGWEVTDLLEGGEPQVVVAERLGVTPQAVSTRLRTAGWRAEQRARPGLVLLLEDLDRGSRSPGADDPGAQ